MDKAVIVGSYHFVGFELCQSLLNKGIEVTGIPLAAKSDPFLEDKKLEIGRNANFTEISISQLNIHMDEDINKEQIVIFSLYDLYMEQEESLLQVVFEPVTQYVKQNKDHTKMVILIPIQKLCENICYIDEFLEQTRECVNHTLYIYLPAVFGPWQPPVFLFHQAIISSSQEGTISLSEREWTEDTLYVTDVAEAIFDLIESGEPGHFLLESGSKQYQEQCAAYVKEKIALTVNPRSLPIDAQIRKVSLKNLTPFPEAITKQEEHVKYYYKNQV